MNQRRHLTIIAAVTTMMAAAPLSTLYIQWTWAFDALIAVGAVCGAALAARALRAPVWAQPLATLAALLLIVTWLNSSGHELLGILPTPGTFSHFRDLLTEAGNDMRTLGIPVFDKPGLLFLTTIGVGLCAIIVDFVAVTIRRPALAGLPMLAVYAVPVAIDPSSVSVIPFSIGAAGFMWLLVTDNIDRVRLFGRRFTGEGRGVDMWEPSPLAAVGRRIAVVGVLLAIIVPVVMPGLTRGLFGQLGQGFSNGDGSGTCLNCIGSTHVDLFANLSGNLNQDKAQVLAHVVTDDPDPYYLRFGVADQLTKKGFASQLSTGAPVSLGLPDPALADPSLVTQVPGALRYRATVSVGPLDMRLLPIFLEPVSGTLDGIGDVWQYDPATSVVFSNEASSQGLSYAFAYDHLNPDQDALRAAQPLAADDPIQVNMTKLPVDVRLVDSVVAEQTRGATSEYDTVLDLYAYFSASHGFSYSLSTKTGTTGTDIGNFLTNKRGYCVQYAAALAWLVRAAHYPARVAFGFTQGKKDEQGTYTLTNKDLHAWTEVYFQGFGWVPFDATPGASLEGSVRTNWAPDVNSLKPTSSSSTGNDVGPSASTSGGPGPARTFKDPGADNGGGPTGGHSASNWPMWVLGIFLILLAAVAAPSVARVMLRLRRATIERHITGDSAAPGEPWIVVDDKSTVVTARARVHAAWDEFVDTLIDYRIPVDPAETPRTAAERVASSLYLPEGTSADIRRLGATEERARYARVPGHSESLQGVVRGIRRALAARVSLRTKLRAVLMPPSVTARWNVDAIAAIARLTASTQAIRDTTLRAFSIRRWLAGPRRASAGR